MDPLSITASIVAIVTAATQVSNGLAKLISLRGAPEIIMALQNEVTDLRLVVSSAQNILDRHVGLGGQYGNVWGLPDELVGVKNSLDRATILLNDICQLAETKLVDSKGRFSKVAYLKEQSRLVKTKDGLKDIRIEIAHGIGLMNSTSSFRIEARIEQLEFALKQSLQALSINNQYNHSRLHLSQEHLMQQLGDIQARTNMISSQGQTQLTKTQPTALTHSSNTFSPTSSLTTGLQNLYHKTPNPLSQYSQGSVTIPLIVRPRSSCNFQCGCVCHSQKDIKTPSILSGLFGSLLIGYSGVPSISPPCNIHSCKRGSAGSVRLQYVFPKWLLTRMLSMRARVYQYPELLIRAWNIRSQYDDVFQAAFHCDLAKLKQLFRDGKGSIMDISCSGGFSLLHFALAIRRAEGKNLITIGRRQLQTVEFLVSQGADLHVAGYSGSTPYSALFELEHSPYGLINSGSYSFQNMKRCFPDTEVEYGSLGLTRIHKILLGIEVGDLARELEDRAGTCLIDRQDKLGRTPLMWAAWKGNESAVQLLLEHGADVTICSSEGHSVLSSATTLTCLDLCLNYTPLSHINSPCPRTGQSILLQILIDRAEFAASSSIRFASRMIKAGADINLGDSHGDTPLIWVASIYINSIALTEHLLRCGADINRTNKDGQTALMCSIMDNCHGNLPVLLRRCEDFDFTIKDNNGCNVLHYLAKFGGRESLKLFVGVAMTGIDVESRDNWGYTPIQVMIYRMEQHGLDSPWRPETDELRYLFTQVLEGARTSQRVPLLQISWNVSDDEYEHSNYGDTMKTGNWTDYGSSDDEFYDVAEDSTE